MTSVVANPYGEMRELHEVTTKAFSSFRLHCRDKDRWFSELDGNTKERHAIASTIRSA